MSKLIIFCADGTWDGPESLKGQTEGASPQGTQGCEANLSNVCKLFAWLRGSSLPPGASWGGAEMEKSSLDEGGSPIQIAKYIHGVGNSKDLLAKCSGGAFGVGVVARIARGYTYISRNYEPGDKIVVVGFSRGAYTARALAGLISGQGLLRPDLAAVDDSDRYDTAVAAWYRWRHGHDSTLQKVVDGVTEFVLMHEAFSKAKALSDDSFIDAPLKAVAVWDTVGAMGIPIYKGGAAVDLFRFCDSSLSSNVEIGIHAIALDEQRFPYTPTLWEDSPQATQALFPGGHADIGGGYSEHGLSDCALTWVVERLQHADIGVAFNLQPPVNLIPDPLAPRHREWVAEPAWVPLGVADRVFPHGMPVNDSVRRRMNDQDENLNEQSGPPKPYKPQNLPI